MSGHIMAKYKIKLINYAAVAATIGNILLSPLYDTYYWGMMYYFFLGLIFLRRNI
jgi:hypothetical protein